MGAHINEKGEFQSDKYPTCPAGKVPLSVKDPTAQDLLWEYAQRRRKVDAEFSDDLESALRAAGYVPPTRIRIDPRRVRAVIGPGGKTIKGIVDQTGVAIDVEDDGTVNVASTDPDAVKRALEIIKGLADPETRMATAPQAGDGAEVC